MASLHFPDTGTVLEGFAQVRDYLAARGILHDRWEADRPLAQDATQDEILEAYAHVLKPYMAANGYTVADVINVHPGTPNLPELRAKFLREHTHTEDEVRFFVQGRGLFWFNLGAGEPIIGVVCTAGDLLSVPAGIAHWFDLGPEPGVKAIRMFIDTSGWVPHYTESGVDAVYNGKVAV
jgi:1,2-dihydroxy-3-keto-5-methylthiopentene dioxygenase